MVVQPDSVTVGPLAVQQFTPYVGNTTNLGIRWNIAEAGGGTITGSGLYTAPLTLGTYHLTVTSLADTTASATATVTVANRVQVTPDAKMVTLSDTVAFSAVVPDTASQTVIWRVVEADGGSISPSGLYTAPRKAGIFHVLASSVEDPSKTGWVVVIVRSGSVTGTIQ